MDVVPQPTSLSSLEEASCMPTHCCIGLEDCWTTFIPLASELGHYAEDILYYILSGIINFPCDIDIVYGGLHDYIDDDVFYYIESSIDDDLPSRYKDIACTLLHLLWSRVINLIPYSDEMIYLNSVIVNVADQSILIAFDNY